MESRIASFKLRVVWPDRLEDRDVKITYFETDLRQHPAIKQLGVENDDAVKYLVLYDQSTGNITVDSSAPKDYKDLAALHEAVCQGHQHEDWAGSIYSTQRKRCSCIEDRIYDEHSIMDTRNLYEYFSGRVAMFSFLLRHNLNPEMNEAFRFSLERCSLLAECCLLCELDKNF